MEHLGVVPDPPELEQGSDHILQWFFELNLRRQPGFSGLSPLTFSDVSAWQSLTGKLTRPEEIEAILAMDTAYIEELNKKKDKPDG